MNSKAMKLKKICTLHNAVVESSHNSDNNVFTWEPNARKTLSHWDWGWRWGRWDLLVLTFYFYHEFYKWKCLGSAEDNIKDVDSRKIRNKANKLFEVDDSGKCYIDGCNRCCGGTKYNYCVYHCVYTGPVNFWIIPVSLV